MTNLIILIIKSLLTHIRIIYFGLYLLFLKYYPIIYLIFGLVIRLSVYFGILYSIYLFIKILVH